MRSLSFLILLTFNIGCLSTLNNETDGIYLEKVDKIPTPVGGMEGIEKLLYYPILAQKYYERSIIECIVKVVALIDENGNVEKTNVIKRIGSGLDQSAMDAVMQTKFTPGILDGEKVKTKIVIPITFKFN